MKKLFKLKIVTLIYMLMIIVIATTAFTLSWYANNSIVKGENATLVTALDTQASATWDSLSDDEYSGEIGNAYDDDPDAPYKSSIQINIDIDAAASTPKLKMQLTKLVITKHELSDEENYIVSTQQVDLDFTIRASLASDLTRVYRRNSEGILVLESIDGELQPSTPETLMPLENGSNVINLDVIFLRESHYRIWLSDNKLAKDDYLTAGGLDGTGMSLGDWIKTQKNNENKPKYFNYSNFSYSHESYMNTSFYISFIYTVMDS